DQQCRVQPLPAAAPEHQGHRRGDGRPLLRRHRRGREPPACAEGGDGLAGRPAAGLSPGTPPFFPTPIQQVSAMSTSSASPPDGNRDIVLAFSGGLDTSFCIPWLRERGW